MPEASLFRKKVFKVIPISSKSVQWLTHEGVTNIYESDSRFIILCVDGFIAQIPKIPLQ